MKTLIRNFAKACVSAPLSMTRWFVTEQTHTFYVKELIDSLKPQDVGLPLLRLGPVGDGGYIVPDDLEGIAACFSPGVSDISGFELACAERGMKVFLADGSVEGPAEAHENFIFSKKFIGANTSEDFMRLDDWVDDSWPEPDDDLLLQMDIEGFEYETLLAATPALLQCFRIIAIEFHNLDQLWNQAFFGIASRTFEKILQTHVCIHIHPNNCAAVVRRKGLEIPPAMEFTFLRKERAVERAPATVFPHPLDSSNVGEGPPIVLPPCWRG